MSRVRYPESFRYPGLVPSPMDIEAMSERERRALIEQLGLDPEEVAQDNWSALDLYWFVEKVYEAPLYRYFAGVLNADHGDHEWRAHCPLHDDRHPSMSINLSKGVWCCHAGCGGGTVAQLLDAEDTWYPPPRGS